MEHGIGPGQNPVEVVSLGEGMEVQFNLQRDARIVEARILPEGFYNLVVGEQVTGKNEATPYHEVVLRRHRSENGRLFTKQYTAHMPINEEGIVELRAGECPPLEHIERKLTKKDYGERVAIGAAIIAVGSLLVKRLYGRKK